MPPENDEQDIIDSYQDTPYHLPLPFLRLLSYYLLYALASAGASLPSALGASVAGSAAGASPEGSVSDDVQRVWNELAPMSSSKHVSGAYQVVPEELHDEGRVLVALLRQGVELCVLVSLCLQVLHLARTSNGIIESLLGQLASLVRRVEDLVVENGKVEGKAEADGVSGSQAGGGNVGGGLVSLKGLVGRGLALVSNGELGKVAVVVTLPVKGQSG